MALPTLRQLQFLTELAAHGTFSRAAEACHVTQPTLSAGIKELESILGVQLVEREARGGRLSKAGRVAAERAARVLAEAGDLVEAVRLASAPLSGPFRLGAIPTIAPFLLPRTVRALRQRYPELSLTLREDLTDRLLDELRNRTLDAALIALPYDAPGIATETLFDDEFLFVGPIEHSLSGADHLIPQDLNGHGLLLLQDGHCLRDHALSVCSLPEAHRETTFSATSLHTLVQMVASGLGVSLLPRVALDSGITAGADLTVRPFDVPVIGRAIGIAWRAGSSREDEARLVGDIVRGAAGLA